MGSPILVSGIRELDPETLAWFICGLLTFELVLASVLDLVPLFKTYRKLRDVVLTRKRQGSEGITGEKEE
ncbi:uncharacterized protein N7496_009702 [Penicillium cataractarum]|uniref:Uncharacterized protein n=1 Tax=Penicillium cataractarum TaxID=2100454 RepID=A0A9W9RRL5_9EURO|nr:uncharacterized protein N7496_009702 [Penicillium cataractarum]KAJ5363989.1 hypothetical protein N7496_009702 [Penicillium cataractarum]